MSSVRHFAAKLAHRLVSILIQEGNDSGFPGRRIRIDIRMLSERSITGQVCHLLIRTKYFHRQVKRLSGAPKSVNPSLDPKARTWH